MPPPHLAILPELVPPSSWQVIGGPYFSGTLGIGLWGQPRGGWEMLGQQQGGSLSPPILHNLKPLNHLRPHNLSEFRCPGRAHPLPLLCPTPALPTNFLPLRSSSSPEGPCCWGHPGRGWRSGYAGASLSTPCVASFLQAPSWEATLKRAAFSVCPGELGLPAIRSSKRVGPLRANLYLFADLTEVYPQLPA